MFARRIERRVGKALTVDTFPVLSEASNHHGYFTLRELQVNVRVISHMRDTLWV